MFGIKTVLNKFASPILTSSNMSFFFENRAIQQVYQPGEKNLFPKFEILNKGVLSP